MSLWSHKLRLADVARGPMEVRLEPDAAARAAIAKGLNLTALPQLTAEITLRPWLDGAEIQGRFRATVGQLCSVTAEPFEQELTGEIDLRVLPAGSEAAAPADSEGGELALDLDAPDPPDVLEGEDIDLGAYLVEHLSLEVDPFPRKPGAEFDYAPDTAESSPFAALRALKDKGE